MGNLHLVTGHSGEAHVSSSDMGSFYSAIFGSGEYVLSSGKKFSASVTTSNNVRIYDGDLMVQGRHSRLESGTYVDLPIDSGSSGYKRNDLIVARYTKSAGTGIEECNLVVIKGTQSSSSAQDPQYTIGDINHDGALQHDFPLYRIPIDGLTVGTPVQLFSVFSCLNGINPETIGALPTTGGTVTGDVTFEEASVTATGKTADGSQKAYLSPGTFQTMRYDNSGNCIGYLWMGAFGGKGVNTTLVSEEKNTSGLQVIAVKGPLSLSGTQISFTKGPVVLASGTHYGDTLPAAGTKGRIFLKKV